MIKEVFPNIYQLRIRMPNSPLALNSYVVKSDERNLIIDTFFDVQECFEATCAGLKELDVDLNKTDFFITHMHKDHSGLVRRLASSNSVIYCSEQSRKDAYSTQSEIRRVMQDFFIGISLNEHDGLSNALDFMNKFFFMSSFPLDAAVGDAVFRLLREGNTINIGNYNFTCVETPGHTPGHACLYEADKKIFLSGDHVLSKIIPNIYLMNLNDKDNPLADYLKSLDKVYRLDIETVLPAHKFIFNNCKERIDEIKNHIQFRIDQILTILKQGSQSVYEVTKKMTWHVNFEEQKWFVVGEAFAHLKYLESENKVKREIRDNVIFYSLVPDSVCIFKGNS